MQVNEVHQTGLRAQSECDTHRIINYYVVPVVLVLIPIFTTVKRVCCDSKSMVKFNCIVEVKVLIFQTVIFLLVKSM